MKAFVPLGFELLPQPAVKRLAAYVGRHPEKATQHVSSVLGEYDGLCHYWPAALVIAPEIARLRSTFLVPFKPFFSYIQANTHLRPHCDGLDGGRKTSIIQPIFPLFNYSPLRFWSVDNQLLHELKLDDYPAIVDLQVLHSVNNTTSHPRFNFQLSIDLPFAEVLALHESGKLIRQVQAGS